MADNITITSPIVLVIDNERVIPIGHLQALVESRSKPGEHHSISWEYDPDTGENAWSCTCRGFECRHACRHVGVVEAWIKSEASVRIVEDGSQP